MRKVALAFTLFFLPAFASAQMIPVKKLSCNNQQSYKVHLTFDDGPKLPETEIILNELKRRNIKATFLISMSHFDTMLNHPPTAQQKKMLALIERMKREGHTVGDHSFEHIEHANLSTEPREKVEHNLAMNDAVLNKLGLAPPPPIPFRFPYGSGWFAEAKPENQRMANSVMAEVKAKGFQPLHWDVDSWDWSRIKRKALPESLLKQICSHEGGVVLMHDIQSFTAQNLGNIIDSIQESNHKLVSYEDIKRYSASRSSGPLDSFSDKVEGIYSCHRPIGDLDQVWSSCGEYLQKSSDMGSRNRAGDQ